MRAAASCFVFLYPVVVAFVWMIGGLYFYLRREHGAPRVEEPPALDSYPLVSLVVPCHDEGPNVRETVRSLLEQRYPQIEVVALDDGSTDDTGAILDALAATDPRLRVVHLAENQGKAVALRTAALAARSEYLVRIDGDAILDEYAAHWMVSHLLSGSRVGAVTGNPRIRNRSTLLGRLQAGEFSSIVGLIKRAQRTYGRIFTVSGVITAFRRTALDRIGYWNDDMLTEDIDISWRLQMDNWDVRYEPRALCSILVPESLSGLWKQRLRWAEGGAQVVKRHTVDLFHWRRRRMWPIVLETLLSATWAATLLVLLVLGVVTAVAVGAGVGLRRPVQPELADGRARLDLHAPVRRQPADRPPLRARHRPVLLLDDLVPDRVLGARVPHRRGRDPVRAARTGQRPCGLGQARTGGWREGRRGDLPPAAGPDGGCRPPQGAARVP